MADVTRQYLNQVKRNIQDSEAFVVLTYHKGTGFKVSSNLSQTGQLQLIIDAGETIRKDALKYTPQKEEAQDEDEGVQD